MYCKICGKLLHKRNLSGYCKDHKHLSPKIKEYQKEYRKKHKQNAKKYQKEYYKHNSEKFKEYTENRLVKNLSEEQYKNRQKSVEIYNHSEKRRIVNKKYNNSESRKKYANIWIKEKRSNDYSFRIRESISANIRNKIKKEKNTDKYADIAEITKHLEAQFDECMNWENYGSYWEIDHIIPQSLFDFTNEEQIKLCWNHRNLRPLCKSENASKSNNIDMQLINEYNVKDIIKKVI